MTNTRLQYRNINKKEPGWLYNLRKMGWDSYHDQPLPDQVVNLWRYTTPDIFLVNQPDELMAPPALPDYQEAGILKIRPEYSGYAFNRPDSMTFALLNP